MKTLSTSTLILTLAVGITASIMSPVGAQLNESFGDSEVPGNWGPDVVTTFPVGPNHQAGNVPPADELTSTYQPEPAYQPEAYQAETTYQPETTYAPENFDCPPCKANVVTDENLFPEVKNVDFFGVDRDECCDEWEGLCKCKSIKFLCGCGGLKANKGHLGIFWLKSKYGGEGCDYCNGGRCKKGCSGKTSSAIKDRLMKGCFLKGRRASDEESLDGGDPPTIFGRPLESNCRRCGCDEGCPPKKGCDSCN